MGQAGHPVGLEGPHVRRGQAEDGERRLQSPAQGRVSDAYPTVGTVVSTSPGPGDIDKGATIVVSVSQGPETVDVPNVVGQSVDQATNTLEGKGLVVTNVFGPQRGSVFTTNPPAGAKVKRGAGVDLYTKR